MRAISVILVCTLAAYASAYPFKLFNKTCSEDFLKTTSCDLLKKDPQKVYENLVVNVCFRYIMNIENQVKPDACIYSGFYAMHYIMEACDKHYDMKLYAESYCHNLPVALWERVEFTHKLWEMKKKKLNSVPYCVDMLDHKLPNYWFSPFLPSNLVTAHEICGTYDSVLADMIKKGYTIWRYAIIYIYEATFQVLLNTEESMRFKECIPQRILLNVKGFCDDVIHQNTWFNFLPKKDIPTLCAVAEENVKIHCHDRTCFPCGLVLAPVYQKYFDISHDMIHKVYDNIEHNVGLLLKTPNPLKVIGPSPTAAPKSQGVLIPGMKPKPAPKKKEKKDKFDDDYDYKSKSFDIDNDEKVDISAIADVKDGEAKTSITFDPIGKGF